MLNNNHNDEDKTSLCGLLPRVCRVIISPQVHRQSVSQKLGHVCIQRYLRPLAEFREKRKRAGGTKYNHEAGSRRGVTTEQNDMQVSMLRQGLHLLVKGNQTKDRVKRTQCRLNQAALYFR
jgi:hypothetical protein